MAHLEKETMYLDPVRLHWKGDMVEEEKKGGAIRHGSKNGLLG